MTVIATFPALGTSGNSPLATNVTIGGGSDRMLVIIPSVYDINISTHSFVLDPAGVNVSATTLVALNEQLTDLNVGAYYILDASLPVAGTYNFEMQWTLLDNSPNYTVFYLEEVAQIAPELSPSTAVALSSDTGFSTTLTTPSTGADVLDGFMSDDKVNIGTTSFAVDPGQISAWLGNITAQNRVVGWSYASNSGATSMSWTRNVGTFNVYQQTVSVAPLVTPPVKQIGSVTLDFTFTADIRIDGSVDTTPPVITLLGPNSVSVELNGVYTDAGATAFDDVDGDITDSIITVSDVDTTTIGTYTVTYYVDDSAGNSATPVVRVVNVIEAAPVPAINSILVIDMITH